MTEEVERYIVELRRLASLICRSLDECDSIVRDIDTRLEALAVLRPGWQITLVADILFHHQNESESYDRRLLSAAVRVPGGVAVCLWQKGAIPSESVTRAWCISRG